MPAGVARLSVSNPGPGCRPDGVVDVDGETGAGDEGLGMRRLAATGSVKGCFLTGPDEPGKPPPGPGWGCATPPVPWAYVVPAREPQTNSAMRYLFICIFLQHERNTPDAIGVGGRNRTSSGPAKRDLLDWVLPWRVIWPATPTPARTHAQGPQRSAPNSSLRSVHHPFEGRLPVCSPERTCRPGPRDSQRLCSSGSAQMSDRTSRICGGYV